MGLKDKIYEKPFEKVEDFREMELRKSYHDVKELFEMPWKERQELID